MSDLEHVSLTEKQKWDYYKQIYRIGELPEILIQPILNLRHLFGFLAISKLQETLINAGFNLSLTGNIDQDTIDICNKITDKKKLLDMYLVTMRSHCYLECNNNPYLRKYVSAPKYKKGEYINLIEQYMSPNLVLSDSEHLANIRRFV